VWCGLIGTTEVVPFPFVVASAAKAAGVMRDVNAALKRCATQKRNSSG